LAVASGKLTGGKGGKLNGRGWATPWKAHPDLRAIKYHLEARREGDEVKKKTFLGGGKRGGTRREREYCSLTLVCLTGGQNRQSYWKKKRGE